MKREDGICPVCQGPTERSSDYDESRILESEEKCRRGCYEYSFACGHSRTRVGSMTWEYSWTDERPIEEVAEAISAMRKELTCKSR